MTWGAIAVGIGGAVIAADSASNAADAQIDSANQASARSDAQFQQNRADQMPWMIRGNQAGNRLGYLMGITPPGSSSLSMMGGTSYDPNRPFDNDLANAEVARLGGGDRAVQQVMAGWGVKLAPAAATQDQQAAGGDYLNDPEFGSLARNFTNEDFVKDPGYEFRLAEGQKGITNQFASRGGLLSGAALKAANRYNQDYASNEFGNAFNRDKSQKADKFNMLSGISGTGQISANQVAVQGAQNATQVGNNTMGGGNARASGYIAQSNALNGALGTGFNAYQQNKLMNSYTPNTYGSGYNPYSGYNAGANGGWGIE